MSTATTVPTASLRPTLLVGPGVPPALKRAITRELERLGCAPAQTFTNEADLVSTEPATDAEDFVVLVATGRPRDRSDSGGSTWLEPLLPRLASRPFVALVDRPTPMLVRDLMRHGPIDCILLGLDDERRRLATVLDRLPSTHHSGRRGVRHASGVVRALHGPAVAPHDQREFVGSSPAALHVRHRIERAAASDCRVLIGGPPGVGKEVVARAIHRRSARADRPMVAVDCGSIPHELFESALFGHVAGAFTGASADRRGWFDEAAEGTLLLDEIGNVPPLCQAKLLRAIQERVYSPVGSTRRSPVRFRLIAATNADLTGMVSSGAFREDLFHRLNVLPIRIPPLVERLADVPALLETIAPEVILDDGAVAWLMRWAWPGNVRELENFVERAAVLSGKLALGVAELEDAATGSGLVPRALGARSAIDEAIRPAVEAAWRRSGGSKTRAARELGLDRRTFGRLCERVGVPLVRRNHDESAPAGGR